MASRPPEDLPQSLVMGAFSGIKNTVSRERLQVGELAAAVNVDIDDVGQVRRRRGYDRKSTANHHSLCTIAGRTYVVRDGTLGILDESYGHRTMAVVGPHPLSYTEVAGTVYYSSSTVSGKLVGGDDPQPWGTLDGGGRWVSPVIRPTETLGAVAGRKFTNPPQADIIEYHKGRIYLAQGPVLWHTELYLYDLIDRTRGFIQFENDITMVRSVSGGLYVGTTAKLYFLRGTAAKGMERTTLIDSPVIRGSDVMTPTADVHPQVRKGGDIPEGNVPMFMTSDGICVGLEDGNVHNLTRGKVVFPGVVSAAALYRGDQGANAYVAVTDSAGGPSANARVGDYVDAEIVRASQRG